VFGTHQIPESISDFERAVHIDVAGFFAVVANVITHPEPEPLEALDRRDGLENTER